MSSKPFFVSIVSVTCKNDCFEFLNVTLVRIRLYFLHNSGDPDDFALINKVCHFCIACLKFFDGQGSFFTSWNNILWDTTFYNNHEALSPVHFVELDLRQWYLTIVSRQHKPTTHDHVLYLNQHESTSKFFVQLV